jgi:hypothetical protein
MGNGMTERFNRTLLPFSRWTTYTGMSLLGWLTILYGFSSHLSAILCFPSKATILTSTLSPDCRMAPRTFLSYPDFCYSCAVQVTEDENSVKSNEINPAPKRQRLRKPRKKPTKPFNNEDTVELESDEESEQEYYVIYTHSHVEPSTLGYLC